MKRLILPSGHVCLLSDEDFKKQGDRSWYALKNGHKTYVVRERLVADGPGMFIIRLHRVILDAPHDKHVDHIDGDGLNNQKSNLRLCTVSQNQMNRGIQRNNTSGYKGVFDAASKRNPWLAQIRQGRKQFYLGRFKTKTDAARAYDEAAKRLFGEFAVLNFPLQQK